ncbi:MAG: P1 family peptidase [Chloroflexi bacterium]|nr:P1 family peptidase [Chloroflexota bacterium]
MCRGGLFDCEGSHVKGAITDVAGIRVGHWTDCANGTGCTVVLCEEGAVGGVDVRGSAPGTRETDLLRPGNLVQEAHAVLLSGGSAFGLAAADGVMRYLEERGIGFGMRDIRVPIVPAAILFDLGVGGSQVRPGPEEGYQACLAASDGLVAEGNVGAGTGATVGKVLGPDRMTKGGIGTASETLGDGVTVGAIVAVNAVGEVVDPDTGEIVAGARNPTGAGFVSSIDIMKRAADGAVPAGGSTTIGVVATDARLTKEQVNKVAQMAQDGLAMAIRPAHTMADGDVVFALATGRWEGPANVTVIGAVAARVMARAIVRAVRQATGLLGVPAALEVSQP